MTKTITNLIATRWDILIVGGGVEGLAAAYFLAAKNANLRIALIDQHNIAEEASSGAAGMLAAQIEAEEPGPFLDFCLYSRELFTSELPRLSAAAGVALDCDFSGIASLCLALGEEPEFHKRYHWQKEKKLAIAWKSKESMQQMFPFLQNFHGGLWAPSDGQISSNRLCEALRLAAEKLGVALFSDVKALPLGAAQWAQRQVETDKGPIAFEKIVFAAGSWMSNLTQERVPVTPVQGQIAIFKIPQSFQEKFHWRAPIYIGRSQGPHRVLCYLVPKSDGHLFLGATSLDRGFDKNIDESAMEEMLHHAVGIFPELENFPFKGSWVGLRPGSKDRQPILGRHPDYPFAYLATGHFRNGILLSLGTGKTLSDLIVEGSSAIDLTAFSLERFLTPLQ